MDRKIWPAGEAASGLPVDNAIIDGEIIVTNDGGISDFTALRRSIVGAPERLVFRLRPSPLNGHLRVMTLLERRHPLEDIIEPAERAIQLSHRLEASAGAVYRAVDRTGLEGWFRSGLTAGIEAGRQRNG